MFSKLFKSELFIFSKKFIIEIISINKWNFILFVSISVLTSLIWIIIPIFAKIETDQLVAKSDNLFWIIYNNPFNIFIVILIIILILDLLKQLINSFWNILEDYINSKYWNIYELRLIERLKNIEIWLYFRETLKTLIEETLNDAKKFFDFLKNETTNTITNFINIIWIIFVLWYFDYKLILLIFLSVFIWYLIDKYMYYFDKKISTINKFEYEEKFRIYKNLISYEFNEIYLNWWVNNIISNYKELSEKQIDFNLKNNNKKIYIEILNFWNINILDILIKLSIWYWIFFLNWSVWLMVMWMMYTTKIKSFFEFFFSFKLKFYDLIDKLKAIKIYYLISEIKTQKNIILNNKIKKIKIENLSFSYPKISDYEIQYYKIFIERLKKFNENRNSNYLEDKIHLFKNSIEESKKQVFPIIKNISFEFEVWKLYWLVWKNWAWKTTLSNLILWCFDSYNWSIKLDWNEIKNIEKNCLIKNIWIITQIPYIISRLSIKENILLWVENQIKDNQIFELLDEFWLKNKIEKLRLGIDSEIWYESNFSWWEKQLLALIRLILQDKQILILDEWTNQLDWENEAIVMEKLLKNRNNKIIIFITHRMTTIKKSNLILCLEDWQIKNIWSHNELIWKDNIYNRFWYIQVEKNF